jgi:hypothetical protein
VAEPIGACTTGRSIPASLVKSVASDVIGCDPRNQ